MTVTLLAGFLCFGLEVFPGCIKIKSCSLRTPTILGIGLLALSSQECLKELKTVS